MVASTVRVTGLTPPGSDNPIQRFLARRLVSKSQRRHDNSGGAGGGSSRSKGVEEMVVAGAQILGVLHGANELSLLLLGDGDGDGGDDGGGEGGGGGWGGGEGEDEGARAGLVPAAVFYSPALSDNLNLREEYMRWIQLDGGAGGGEGEGKEMTLGAASAAAAAAAAAGVAGRDAASAGVVGGGESNILGGGAAAAGASASGGSTSSASDALLSSSSHPHYPAHLRPGELGSFCQLPFLLTPEAKGRILQVGLSLPGFRLVTWTPIPAVIN
jgi:hypothetical protein